MNDSIDKDEKRRHKFFYSQKGFLKDKKVIGLTEEEASLLDRHGVWLDALLNGNISAITPAQKKFIDVCTSNLEAKTPHEMAWLKYQHLRRSHKELTANEQSSRRALRKLAASQEYSYEVLKSAFSEGVEKWNEEKKSELSKNVLSEDEIDKFYIDLTKKRDDKYRVIESLVASRREEKREIDSERSREILKKAILEGECAFDAAISKERVKKILTDSEIQKIYEDGKSKAEDASILKIKNNNIYEKQRIEKERNRSKRILKNSVQMGEKALEETINNERKKGLLGELELNMFYDDHKEKAPKNDLRKKVICNVGDFLNTQGGHDPNR